MTKVKFETMALPKYGSSHMTLHGAITSKTTPYISTNMITSELKHSVSKILGQTSGVNSHNKTRKQSSYQCMPILRFQGTPQHCVDLIHLDLYLLQSFKILVYSAPNEYKKDNSPTHFWCWSNHSQLPETL